MDASQDTLLRLLSATAQGNQAAFARLYESTAGRLYAVSLQMLRRKELAEDAVQEAYVRIWHNAGDYQHEKGAVLTWMISIVRYRALDTLRAQKSRREVDSDQAPEHQDSASPERHFYEKRDRALIDDCMDRLDGPQRQAIHMAYFNGLTHFEVCAQLAAPLGSVKSWIRRGLERLKRCLEL